MFINAEDINAYSPSLSHRFVWKGVGGNLIPKMRTTGIFGGEHRVFQLVITRIYTLGRYDINKNCMEIGSIVFQYINHIPKGSSICRKDNLVRYLRVMKKIYGPIYDFRLVIMNTELHL